jgi:hypothetical protein
MDNCDIIEVCGNTLKCVCLLTGQNFEVMLHG